MRLAHLPCSSPLAFAMVSLLFLLVPSIASAQSAVTVSLAPTSGSSVSGTMTLTAHGDATDATLYLKGFPVSAEGTATLHALCERQRFAAGNKCP